MTATRIPTVPLILGLSGLIPFIWGAATHLIMPAALLDTPSWQLFTGRNVLLAYGITILSFMSGTIWGFATRSPNPTAAWGFALSVLPALFGFFAFRAAPGLACLALVFGFVALLSLDLRAIRLAEAPHWWLPLRLILTTVVCACLLVGAFA
ncbi:MAG: DUF3429 domain-containing protein [Pseudomonadota bacterium]